MADGGDQQHHDPVCKVRKQELRMLHAPSHSSSELVSIALLLALALRCLDSHLLVILLKRCEIFAGLGELALLHAFPTYQCTKARLEYMRSNLWSMREKTSAIAVLLEIMQQAMYLPWRGSHFTNMEAGSQTDIVISATESCSWYAFSAEMIGA